MDQLPLASVAQARRLVTFHRSSSVKFNLFLIISKFDLLCGFLIQFVQKCFLNAFHLSSFNLFFFLRKK